MKPFQTIDDIRKRTSEAVLSQSRIDHPALSAWLRHLFVKGDPGHEALVQQPVLEGAFPYVTADTSFGDLAGNLLDERLVDVLDGGDDASREYTFKRHFLPYSHQIESWQQLAQPDRRSIIVTSGTGSGKTECFLIPVLNDILKRQATEQEADGSGGVEAIMLYPLNALIASQKKRLAEWTAPFDGQVQFCLYNGLLPEDDKATAKKQSPNEVLDRADLRRKPPQILVTNKTMLEYMLIRPKDRDILQKSQGRLKWIVFDEAHSLVGTAAAEVALLIRRVLLAFDVEAKDVRFIATSATIGSGPDTATDLKRFLAGLAGVSEEQVFVIRGENRKPALPDAVSTTETIDRNWINSASAAELYDKAGVMPEIRQLVVSLFDGPVSWRDYSAIAARLGLDGHALTDLMTKAQAPDEMGNAGQGDRLAQMRVHGFLRAVSGIWSCINHQCAEKPEGWEFGKILPERADRCPACQSLVLEILSCGECGQVMLEGEETGNHDFLKSKHTPPPHDEFTADAERDSRGGGDEEGDDENQPAHHDHIIMDRTCLFPMPKTCATRPLYVNLESGRLADTLQDNTVRLNKADAAAGSCPCCAGNGTRISILKPIRFGAPFLLGNTAPLLLEGADPEETVDPAPSQGRKLLSFTDSRQGTARLSAKFQIESERNYVRSFIYHSVQRKLLERGDAETITDLEKRVSVLETTVKNDPLNASTFSSMLEDFRVKLAEAQGGTTKGIDWLDMVRSLEGLDETGWMMDVWTGREPDGFTNRSSVARFLLLRELSRRPKTATSIETLGLARLVSPAVGNLTTGSLPAAFRSAGKRLEDWQDFLNYLLTFLVRNNRAIVIDQWMQRWTDRKGAIKKLLKPGDFADRRDERAWPSTSMSPNSRAIQLLCFALNLRLDDTNDRGVLIDILDTAWRHLRSPLHSDASTFAQLNFEKLAVAPLRKAWFCPLTNRVLDTAPFGISPYGAHLSPPARAVPIELPQLPCSILTATNKEKCRDEIRYWLEHDERVADLRERGCWDNINDRNALFADYARSAEHSAQQSAQTLRAYEEQFQDGQLNILNCSTTMEMGVDIGSVSTVMMTNVPPSIANYRQRIGRAGRRGQALSLGFTFAKDRPLDQEAYRDPVRYLGQQMIAPTISLRSEPVVQRHVNALLIAGFINQAGGNALRMEIGDFMGWPGDCFLDCQKSQERNVERFLAWLDRPETRDTFAQQIRRLVGGSILEGSEKMFEAAADMMKEVETGFVAEWTGLRSQSRDESGTKAAQNSIRAQLRRLCEEFLPSALADRGFLPAHGFPNHVVSFLPAPGTRGSHGNQQKDNPFKENPFQRSDNPQRNLDMAIRDYAPGSEIVLDGIVHRSAGVTLNWQRPASDNGVREVQSLRHNWNCYQCGSSGSQPGAQPVSCKVCNAQGLSVRRFLKPSGFAADWRDQVHADIESIDYIPPREPEVSVGEAAWAALPREWQGRMRSSSKGRVYYSSGGQGGAWLCHLPAMRTRCRGKRRPA